MVGSPSREVGESASCRFNFTWLHRCSFLSTGASIARLKPLDSHSIFKLKHPYQGYGSIVHYTNPFWAVIFFFVTFIFLPAILWYRQCSLAFKVYTSHLRILFKVGSNFIGLDWGQRFYFLDKHPGHAETAGIHVRPFIVKVGMILFLLEECSED